MWPDRVSNPGPMTYESGALPTALRGLSPICKRKPSHCFYHHGPVVQSVVSLTSSLRGQLVKCFTTLLLNTLIFFVEKMREAFAMQKLLTLFQQKILAYIRY